MKPVDLNALNGKLSTMFFVEVWVALICERELGTCIIGHTFLHKCFDQTVS